MPKEEIKTRSGGTKLVVGWSSDKFAQVGVVMDPRSSDEPQTLADLVKDNPGVPEHQGLFLTFDFVDRASFNHAIRALRKARDSVCGKDE